MDTADKIRIDSRTSEDSTPGASGTIFKIKRYALHDGPGIRTTIFLKGCPLSCWWCHNPEGISLNSQAQAPCHLSQANDKTHDGEPETIGNRHSVTNIMAEIEKDTLFYDESGGGATFSGGEPLAQPRFLTTLLTECRKREIHTAVDTSGFASQKVLTELLPLMDLLLFDLKLMDNKEHLLYTGVSNGKIMENLKLAAWSDTPVRLRLPLIPSITDTAKNIEAVMAFIKTLGPIAGLDLLPFHALHNNKYQRLGLENKLAGTAPMSQEKATLIQEQFTLAGHRATLGG